ncbi:MmcQ/YjbR family DNA-binding protein [Fulvivirga sp.]|uniref:MmcQ/YjbR family DNA-binding protein n=1 Tax=Fulvivirga sp. TaxID=1931237 RepID=UPI0032EF3FF5
MIKIDNIRTLALSFPEATEEPHFEKNSFRVKKKIFATHDTSNNRLTIKLSEADQNLFSLIDKNVIYAVDNKWGKQGWTIVELSKVSEEVLKDALATAYCEVAPKKLADMVRNEE